MNNKIAYIHVNISIFYAVNAGLVNYAPFDKTWHMRLVRGLIEVLFILVYQYLYIYIYKDILLELFVAPYIPVMSQMFTFSVIFVHIKGHSCDDVMVVPNAY